MPLVVEELEARRIVNVHKHVDGAWFWSRYSARPYIGCRAGCAFCYLRGGVYLGRRDPADFDTRIQVKMNAPELLDRALARLPVDVICAATGSGPSKIATGCRARCWRWCWRAAFRWSSSSARRCSCAISICCRRSTA